MRNEGTVMMKIGKVIAVFFLFVLLAGIICVSAESDEVPMIARKVSQNKEFFVDFKGYNKYKLYDLIRVNKDLIILTLFDDTKIMHTIIFNAKTRKAENQTYRIMEKDVREAMYKKSITIPDAIKIAKFVSDANKEVINIISSLKLKKKNNDIKTTKKYETPVKIEWNKEEELDKLKAQIKASEDRGEKYDTTKYMKEIRQKSRRKNQ
jgi:hypothetical protein